jgi:hypothetical protein
MASATHGVTITDWITASAAALAVIGAALTLIDNRRTARRRATFDYLQRVGDLALNDAFATMSSFLRGGLRPPEIEHAAWAKMKEGEKLETTELRWRELLKSSALEDRKLVMCVCAYPNMLEGLAAMYNQRLLDRRIVKAQVETDALGYLDVAKWWVTAMRESDPSSFLDTRVMMKDLKKRKKPKWYRDIPAPTPSTPPTPQEERRIEDNG